VRLRRRERAKRELYRCANLAMGTATLAIEHPSAASVNYGPAGEPHNADVECEDGREVRLDFESR